MAMHSPSDLDTLLDKLATDDAFRDYLTRDPAGALGSIGISIDPGQVPAITTLPSKDAVARDRAVLRQKLDSTVAAIPFLLSGTI